jgi:predicted DCC family thiol-disulfide oxidoreductase YuxK
VIDRVSAVKEGENPLLLPLRGGALVFDGYCGFCTRSVHILLRMDCRTRIRALPLQGPRVLELTKLTRAQALHEAWWIGADGKRTSGAGAIITALSVALGLPLERAYRVPGLRQFANWAYRWIAEHRRLFRGVTPHCVAHPDAGCDADTGMSCGR